MTNIKQPSVLNLLNQAPESKLQVITEKIEQVVPLQVLPLGIVDTKPIIENLNDKTQYTVDALKEVADNLQNLITVTNEASNKPDYNTEILAKLDEIGSVIVKLSENADLEREMLLQVKTELSKQVT